MGKLQKRKSRGIFSIKNIWKLLGPGFVTGAADDDPSGVVTYSQAGAQYGLGQLWTAILMLPFLIAIQEMCARIGIVTRKGLARNIKEHYPRWVLLGAVGLLCLANTINLGADLGAMGASVQLFIRAPFTAIVVVFFVIIVTLEIFVSYHRYSKILKWLTLTLLAYILAGLFVAHGWSTLFRATFLPHLTFNATFFILLTGIIGTTISPYMFFWQASQEIEETKDAATLPPLTASEEWPPLTRLSSMRLDTTIGMLFSEIGSWFIIMTTALVLHANGVTNISTAAQAAQALEPLVHAFPHSGLIAEALFAVGIIGAGLIAVPIFAATSAYAVAEIFNWREGLSYKLDKAKGFYGIIAIGTLAGLLLNFFGVNPISALVYTAVLNGVIAPPLIFLLIHIANNKTVMGRHTNGVWSNIFSWATFIFMSAAIIIAVWKLV